MSFRKTVKVVANLAEQVVAKVAQQSSTTATRLALRTPVVLRNNKLHASTAAKPSLRPIDVRSTTGISFDSKTATDHLIATQIATKNIDGYYANTPADPIFEVRSDELRAQNIKLEAYRVRIDACQVEGEDKENYKLEIIKARLKNLQNKLVAIESIFEQMRYEDSFTRKLENGEYRTNENFTDLRIYLSDTSEQLKTAIATLNDRIAKLAKQVGPDVRSISFDSQTATHHEEATRIATKKIDEEIAKADPIFEERDDKARAANIKFEAYQVRIAACQVAGEEQEEKELAIVNARLENLRTKLAAIESINRELNLDDFFTYTDALQHGEYYYNNRRVSDLRGYLSNTREHLEKAIATLNDRIANDSLGLKAIDTVVNADKPIGFFTGKSVAEEEDHRSDRTNTGVRMYHANKQR